MRSNVLVLKAASRIGRAVLKLDAMASDVLIDYSEAVDATESLNCSRQDSGCITGPRTEGASQLTAIAPSAAPRTRAKNDPVGQSLVER
jgi:hypothetical protein